MDVAEKLVLDSSAGSNNAKLCFQIIVERLTLGDYKIHYNSKILLSSLTATIYRSIKHYLMLSLLRIIGNNDLLYYFCLALATSCIYAVGFDKTFVGEAAGLRLVLTLTGVFLACILAASYTLLMVEKRPFDNRPAR